MDNNSIFYHVELEKQETTMRVWNSGIFLLKNYLNDLKNSKYGYLNFLLLNSSTKQPAGSALNSIKKVFKSKFSYEKCLASYCSLVPPIVCVIQCGIRKITDGLIRCSWCQSSKAFTLESISPTHWSAHDKHPSCRPVVWKTHCSAHRSPCISVTNLLPTSNAHVWETAIGLVLTRTRGRRGGEVRWALPD